MTRRLDHVVHAVDDLDTAAAGYEKLGFFVTPRADHPFGTSNRLVIVEDAYLEILAITGPRLLNGAFAEHARRFLQTGPGIAAIALRAENADADREALAAGGIEIGAVATFARPATLADGSETEARFSIALTSLLASPLIFLCQHHTPDAVWDPGSMRHPNRAARISALGGEGDIDAGTADALELLVGGEVTRTPRGMEVGLGGSPIVLRGSGPPTESRLAIDTLEFAAPGAGAAGEVAGVGVRVGV